MGQRALRKIQIGEESTKGTAVAATAVLLGLLTMKESPTIHRPVEERGTFAEFSRSVKVANLAELTFEGDALFEQILCWLHMGVLGNVTPTDADPKFTWTFTPAMAAAGVFDSFTLEYGDDVEQFETEFCLARTIEISGAMGEPMKIRADMFGRKMTVCDFTASLVAPAVESVLTQKARLYIDDHDKTDWATGIEYTLGQIVCPTLANRNGYIYECTAAGTSGGTEPTWLTTVGGETSDGATLKWTCRLAAGRTEKSATLIAFTFTITTGLAPKRLADGSIDFSSYQETFKGAELSMTFAFNAGAETERLLYDGETKRVIRIRATGGEAKTKVDSTATLSDSPLAAGVTTVNISDGTLFQAHEAMQLDDEQCWITSISANALTVIRGWNGTADVQHTAGIAVYMLHLKELILDICGIYTDWETLSERDGEDIVEVTLSSQMGTNYAKLFEVAVINTVSTLP